MPRLLLDTHVLLWALSRQSPLGPEARAAIEETSEGVYVSVASVWEIAIKRASGKLRVTDRLRDVIAESGFIELLITFPHAEQAGALPRHHGDPFDRMLVAQAQMEGLVLVTVDRHIQRYDVRTMSARR